MEKRKKLPIGILLFLLVTVFCCTFSEAADEFEEQVLVDNEECSVIITGIDAENSWGYTLNVYLENKSSNLTYMFAVNDGAINGLEKDPFFAKTVAPGKMSNETISFSSLSDYGIEEVTDIALYFRVYDDDDWTADDVVNDVFHIYPLGEENVVKYEREPQDSDIILVDTDDVTVIVTGFEEDAIWGFTADLFLENNTDTTVMYSVNDASVNGFMLDPFWATSVSAGNCAFSSMSWSNSKLEENGISEIYEIEMTLRAYDDDDWMADDFANETVILNP